jgi:hypothetical protein
MARNLWTVWEEATAYGPAQAAAENSLISVPIAAVRGKIKSNLIDSGDMWIVTAQRPKAEARMIESLDVLARSYQRPLLPDNEDN